MNWLYYLAEANLYLCVFYLAYCVFLVKETHYQLTRAYLLLSCIMAFVLPVLQVGALRPEVIDNAPAVSYLVTQSSQYVAPSSLISAPVTPAAPAFTVDYLWLVYVVGAVVVLLLLAIKLYSVFRLTRNNKTKLGGYKMVHLKDTDVAFSFFNYLFIGTRAVGSDTIITHELVHIRQKHSADIMFLEMLKVICWFNPCIYLLQNSLKTVHEYIADEQTAAREADAFTYSSFLVNNAYGAGGSSITHSFFKYNLLKKRIIMLNQQRSGKLARLKYLIALPVCASLLCASTLAFSKTYGWIVIAPAEKVISLPDTLKTSKGFKYKEKIYSKNGFKYCDVTFFEPNGQTKTFTSDAMTGKKLNLLTQHYGYEFPKGTVPPPPPPMPPKSKVDKVKFPPRPKVDQVRFPPSVNGELKSTSKGYKYEETGYLIDGKETNFRVIFHEKNGEEKAFFRNSATEAQLKLLKDKYGYTFPNMVIQDRMPPSPPMPPVAQPAKPTSALLNKRNSNGGSVARAALNNVIVDPENNTSNRVNAMPLILVNDKPIILSKQQKDVLKSGGNLSFSASDSTISYGKNDPYALSKWGSKATNGAVALYGKTSVTTVK